LRRLVLAPLLISLAAATPNPCADASLHLLCPDLVMRAPSNLFLVRRGHRRLLTSTNAIINTGAGPLEVRGTRTGAKEMTARQVIHGPRTVIVRGTGSLYFKDVPPRGGFYWKYENAARFELWRLDAAGALTSRVRVGPKIFYCLRDLFHVRPYGRRSARFPSCRHPRAIGQVTLGISRGWADAYPSTYPGNWIDVTGLRGCFAYVHVADPLNHLMESNENDNAGKRAVRLPWRGPGLRGCPRAHGPRPTGPPGLFI
jgi:hypothetical protein